MPQQPDVLTNQGKSIGSQFGNSIGHLIAKYLNGNLDWGRFGKLMLLTGAIGVFGSLALWSVIFNLNQDSIQTRTVTDTKTLSFTNDQGVKHTLTLELANTESSRARGLMYRTSLEQGRGMLFMFDTPQSVTFWMQNTYISLDIIFLDSTYTVTKIAASTIPNQIDTRYPSDSPVQYVIETNAGWSTQTELQIGDKFGVENF